MALVPTCTYLDLLGWDTGMVLDRRNGFGNGKWDTVMVIDRRNGLELFLGGMGNISMTNLNYSNASCYT